MIQLLTLLLNQAELMKKSAHVANPYGSSKWKKPAHHRPYLSY